MKYEKHFEADTDGFRGSYYPCKEKTDKAFIEMFGDDTDDYLAKRGVKWFHSLNCSVMTMSPDKKDYGHHSYPYAFKEAKGYKKECRETRERIDEAISKAVHEW